MSHLMIISFFSFLLVKPVVSSISTNGQIGKKSFITQFKTEKRNPVREPANIINKRASWPEMDRDDPDEVDPVNDYEMYEELAGSYSYSSLLPFLRQHFKTCPSDTPKVDCRPFYMPCKSELACAISCRVNDYSCGSCSDTNSFRKVCQCCDLQASAALLVSV